MRHFAAAHKHLQCGGGGFDWLSQFAFRALSPCQARVVPAMRAESKTVMTDA
jgi:hypothetical protein